MDIRRTFSLDSIGRTRYFRKEMTKFTKFDFGMTKNIKVRLLVILAFIAVPSLVLFVRIVLLSTRSYPGRALVPLPIATEQTLQGDAAAISKKPLVASEFHTFFNICHEKRKTNLLVFAVVTSPSHFKRRQKIRSTWGSVKRYSGAEMLTIFFIGAVIDVTLQEAISLEAQAHRDLFQDSSYIDAYRNLTSKSVSILRWSANHCPNALHVIKVDDDTLVHPYNVVHFLRSKKNYIVDKLICSVISDVPPIRIIGHPWYVSFNEYNETLYPNYCDGFSYLIPQNMIGKLLEASKKASYLSVEDVYITGILRELVGMSQFDLDPSQSTTCEQLFMSCIEKFLTIKTVMFIGHTDSLLHYDVFWRVVRESRQRN